MGPPIDAILSSRQRFQEADGKLGDCLQRFLDGDGTESREECLHAFLSLQRAYEDYTDAILTHVGTLWPEIRPFGRRGH